MLGCGFMGKCHTNAYKKIPYIYPAAGVMPRLVVLCDKKAEKVERGGGPLRLRGVLHRLAASWPPTRGSTCSTTAGPTRSIPSRASPPWQHGKHVICEKPMAVSVADARRMRDAAAAARGKSMCTFNYRFMPAVRLAKDLIAEGKIGTIYQMRVNYLQMAGHDPSLPPEQGWYSAWPHSGGLQGIGSHAIDQCRFLVGEIASVSALVRTFNRDRAIPCGRRPPT